MCWIKSTRRKQRWFKYHHKTNTARSGCWINTYIASVINTAVLLGWWRNSTGTKQCRFNTFTKQIPSNVESTPTGVINTYGIKQKCNKSLLNKLLKKINQKKPMLVKFHHRTNTIKWMSWVNTYSYFKDYFTQSERHSIHSYSVNMLETVHSKNPAVESTQIKCRMVKHLHWTHRVLNQKREWQCWLNFASVLCIESWSHWFRGSGQWKFRTHPCWGVQRQCFSVQCWSVLCVWKSSSPQFEASAVRCGSLSPAEDQTL